MSYFVGYDIGVGEIAAASDCRLHVAEEIQVDIDCLIGRTVEGACLRGTLTATCLHGILVDDEFRLAVFTPAVLAEFLAPHIFGASKYFRRQVEEICVGLVLHVFGV